MQTVRNDNYDWIVLDDSGNFAGFLDHLGRLIEQGPGSDVTLSSTQTLSNKTLNTTTFTGTVSGLTKTHVGLANVDNTSDANKPVSTAQSNALALKVTTPSNPTGPAVISIAADGTISTVLQSALGGSLSNIPTATVLGRTTSGTGAVENLTFSGLKTAMSFVKGDVGLGNVDNTSDVNKPVSTAQQTALDLKITKPSNPAAPAAVTQNADGTFTTTLLSSISSGFGNIPTATFLGRTTSGTGAVETLSVATTKTALAYTKSDIGLSNVDNTSDASKPISTATQSALDAKAAATATVNLTGGQTVNGVKNFIDRPTVGGVGVLLTGEGTGLAPIPTMTVLARTASGTGTVENLTINTTFKTALGLVKADVGLGSVDNTADTAKPVSTAQQTALDLKAPLANPAFTGTPTGITKTHVGLGNVDNTADASKPVSTAQQTALDAKITKPSNPSGPSILTQSSGGVTGTTLLTDLVDDITADLDDIFVPIADAVAITDFEIDSNGTGFYKLEVAPGFIETRNFLTGNFTTATMTVPGADWQDVFTHRWQSAGLPAVDTPIDGLHWVAETAGSASTPDLVGTGFVNDADSKVTSVGGKKRIKMLNELMSATMPVAITGEPSSGLGALVARFYAAGSAFGNDNEIGFMFQVADVRIGLINDTGAASGSQLQWVWFNSDASTSGQFAHTSDLVEAGAGRVTTPFTVTLLFNGPNSKLRVNGVNQGTIDLTGNTGTALNFHTIDGGGAQFRGDSTLGPIYICPGGANQAQITAAEYSAGVG